MEEYFEKLSVERRLDFFISYRQNTISKLEVDNVCNYLVLFEINSVRDKYKLEAGDSINDFMDSLTECDGVVLLICSEYFFSINCMYEGITAMQNCKNRTLIRMIECDVYSNDFKKRIVEFWNTFDKNGILDKDKKKVEKVLENYQEFVFWISDTNSVNPNDTIEFKKELKKHIGRVFLENYNYINLISDLVTSKEIIISKVCDPACEKCYYYRNINYSIRESSVEYFRCFYDFVLTLEECNTNRLVKIFIHNVVGIQEGTNGKKFAKYYFVIPKQESLDTLAFEEKIGKERTKVEYDRQRVIINF
jgi:hypothetical protein